MSRTYSRNKRFFIKRVISSLLLVLAVCILGALSFIAYLSINLELWSGNEQSSVKELSPQQRMDDFKYLTSFVKNVYPYSEALVKNRCLDDINALEETYIERAKSTKSNSDYFKLVYEYVMRLRNGDAHNSIYFGSYQPQNISIYNCLVYNIKKSSYYKTDYWGNEAAKFKWYAYSDAEVKYSDGKYILDAKYKFHDITLPQGTVIEKVNGIQADDYVNQYRWGRKCVYLTNRYMPSQ